VIVYVAATTPTMKRNLALLRGGGARWRPPWM